MSRFLIISPGQFYDSYAKIQSFGHLEGKGGGATRQTLRASGLES